MNNRLRNDAVGNAVIGVLSCIGGILCLLEGLIMWLLAGLSFYASALAFCDSHRLYKAYKSQVDERNSKDG